MLINYNVLKHYKKQLLLVVASLILYWCFAYLLIRTEYAKLLGLYVVLFILFYNLIKNLKNNTKALSYIAFVSRAIFIIAIPNLSQDFYRFIWDGRVLFEGINPYLFTVESFISQNKLPVHNALQLREGMGSLNASHFSNYPPINQLCFFIAALFSSKSITGAVVVLRLVIIAADFGTLHFGKKLLKKLELPEHNIFWYILNPFIIIELTGNLHFEGVMIFFLVWSMYLLYHGKWQFAGVILALSISVKLIPLIFLPLFFQWFVTRNTKINKAPKTACNKAITSRHIPTETLWHKLTKLIGFYTIVITTTILLFVPFYTSEFINNYSKTVGLWFKNFEFNGSFYYVAREIGYLFRGYNEIAIIGSITPILVIIFVLIVSFLRKNKSPISLITAMLLVLSFYYFTATTVHPWYVATLLILSVFTKYKFPLVWSFVIILSYLAYINLNKADKSENLWIITLEYIIVYAVLIWDLLKPNKKPTL